MFASCVERRFYRAFSRRNHTTTPLNHIARNSRRLLSSSATRRTSAVDAATSSDEPIPTAQPPISPQQEIPAGDGQGKNEPWEEDRHLYNLRKTIRNMFRCVAHPVAIVTALGESMSDGSLEMSNEWEDVLNTLRAMTVSSLNTVSLDPTPIISFNVRIPSSTWDAIRTQGRFRVFLPKSSERGLNIAAMFAKGDAREGFRTLLEQSTEVNLHRPGGQLRLGAGTLEWKTLEKIDILTTAPFIKSYALAGCLIADVLPEKCVQVNDHVIVVAEVKYHQAVSRELSEGGLHARNPTLSYFNHDYVRVDRPVVANSAWEKRSMAVVTPPRNVRNTSHLLKKKRDGTNGQDKSKNDMDGQGKGKNDMDGQGKGKNSENFMVRRVEFGAGLIRRITFYQDGTTRSVEVDPESADYRQSVHKPPSKKVNATKKSTGSTADQGEDEPPIWKVNDITKSMLGTENQGEGKHGEGVLDDEKSLLDALHIKRV